eukprot:TRINITY_DN31039_c0_g1_i1.p1 TRINITY_DN31039_c0_g1~~TRINITY_DN31039_c0_g1_i1.p1  ORF type:complete len:441 (+),score=73.21 TRINITY_DN31039_c0_g1_i1:75-1397(+)
MAHSIDASSPAERLFVFYSLHAPDKLQSVPKVAASFVGKEESMYRKLEEKYGAWRFFEVWSAIDDFYRAYYPSKTKGVSKLVRDWHPRGFESLLTTLESRYRSTYFTDRGLIPLNDASRQRSIVEALYRRYEPLKTNCIGTMMGAYRGHEDELIKLLKLKYEGIGPTEEMLVPIGSQPPIPSMYSIAAGVGAVPVSPSVSPQRIRSSRMSPKPPDNDVITPSDLPGSPDGWIPPTKEDLLCLVEAMKRKDLLIAKQTAAIQEHMKALSEQKNRSSQALSIVPHLLNQSLSQTDTIERLNNAMGEARSGIGSYPPPPPPPPPPPQVTTGGIYSPQAPAHPETGVNENEVAKQVDLTALAKILELNVPPDFITSPPGCLSQQASSTPPSVQPHDSLAKLRGDAYSIAQYNIDAFNARQRSQPNRLHTELNNSLLSPPNMEDL